MDFQDQDTQQQGKNPFNANVLKGGQVDPRSKLYQRSVAGREKLDEMLSRLWSDGMDEADVFMAGVKALTSRDKGYVGAYLDSKNPGRRYQENEAMAITDQVMKNLGIGSHPGNRLTREKDEEGKAKRKEEATARGGYGPKQAPGKKAMPVGQQRKEGKRESTGQPVEGSQREGLGQPETGPRSEWQKTLQDRMEGKATTADVLQEFQKQYQSKLSQSPEAQAKREEKQKGRRDELRQRIAEDKRLQDREAVAEGPEPETEGPTRAIEGRIKQDLGNAFKSQYDTFRKGLIDAEKRKSKGAWDPSKEKYIQPEESQLRDLIDLAIEDTQEKHGNIDAESAKSQLRDYLVNTLGVDPYEEEIPAAPEAQAASTKGAAAPEPEDEAKPGIPPDQITNLFRAKYNQNKKDALERAKAAARKAGQLAPKTAKLTPDDLEYIAQETADDLGTDLDTATKAINEKFGLNIGGPQQQPEESAAPEAPTAAPEPEAPSRREVTSKGGFKAPAQQAGRKGGGGFTPSPKELRAVKEKVAKSTPEQIIKEFKQGTLFPAGLTTETSATNPLEGGSAATPEQTPAPEAGGQEPPEAEKAGAAGQQSMFKMGTLQPRSGKGFGSNVAETAQPTGEKATQRSIRGLGPSAGKFNTTREKKAGDELLTQNLKSYGFTPKQVKEIQKSGLTEQERQQITSRRGKEQEVKESQRKAPEPAEQPGLLTDEGSAKDFTKSGPANKPPTSSQKTSTAKGKSPLDQVAKAVLSGLERDKAARESAGQFFNRVRDLIQKQAGQGASKSDVDQAAAKAINQQKGRKTRNKTVNSAEYQEFAQSIRSMMR
jgi:hypothetical protein